MTKYNTLNVKRFLKNGSGLTLTINEIKDIIKVIKSFLRGRISQLF